MMACCILAAIILGQILATVRRWGIFWGVVTPHEWENPETVLNRIEAWFARPRVKRAVFAVAGLELAALASWVTVAHGTHLYQLGDQFAGSLQGQHIVYADVCGRDGKDHTLRIVVNRREGPLLREKLANAT